MGDWPGKVRDREREREKPSRTDPYGLPAAKKYYTGSRVAELLSRCRGFRRSENKRAEMAGGRLLAALATVLCACAHALSCGGAPAWVGAPSFPRLGSFSHQRFVAPKCCRRGGGGGRRATGARVLMGSEPEHRQVVDADASGGQWGGTTELVKGGGGPEDEWCVHATNPLHLVPQNPQTPEPKILQPPNPSPPNPTPPRLNAAHANPNPGACKWCTTARCASATRRAYTPRSSVSSREAPTSGSWEGRRSRASGDGGEPPEP